jgi:hypothetical protein
MESILRFLDLHIWKLCQIDTANPRDGIRVMTNKGMFDPGDGIGMNTDDDI